MQARNWNERHLSEDELIAALYEAAPADTHLDSCLYCRGRMRTLEKQHKELGKHHKQIAVAQDVLSEQWLAGQRARIYSRLGEKPSSHRYWLWAGAPLAAAAALLISVKIQTPEPVEAPVAAVVEDKLYTDIYQTLQETPAGVYSVAGMFETTAGTTSAAVKD